MSTFLGKTDGSARLSRVDSREAIGRPLDTRNLPVPLRRLARSVLSPAPISRSTALTAAERLSAVTHLVASLEYLAAEDIRAPGGLNNWEITWESVANQPEFFRKVLEVVSDRRVTRALLMARAGASAALLAPMPRPARLAANAVVSASALVLYPRHTFGTDGSDQVALLVQMVATIARAGGDRSEIVDACLWFLAMQATLSYTASGLVKVAGRAWPSGQALPGIMRTYNYGEPSTWRLLRKYPRLGPILGAGTLAFESMFPAAFASRGRLAPALVATAVTFHLINARVMGLGRFVPSFAAMHPALLYAAGPREYPNRAQRTSRDDLTPKIAGTVAAATFVGGLVRQQWRRRVVDRGRDGEHLLTTSSGNTLCYRGTVPAHGTEPVVIFESGLSASTEQWEWINNELSSQFPTITYHRAGYGRSRYAGGKDYRLDVAVNDLVDLVKHVAGDRPVILVGHSLGGYLVLRALTELPGHVQGVGLLDTSHPEQLQRSNSQARGAEHLADLIRYIPSSLRLGLGWLLQSPPWLNSLPQPVRRSALAHWRDPRMWAATWREWHATRKEFDNFDGALPNIDVPLCVVTAEKTAKRHPEQVKLHEELAAAAPHGQRHVLPNADHIEMLTAPNQAIRVADLLVEFVNSLSHREEKAADAIE